MQNDSLRHNSYATDFEVPYIFRVPLSIYLIVGVSHTWTQPSRLVFDEQVLTLRFWDVSRSEDGVLVDCHLMDVCLLFVF